VRHLPSLCLAVLAFASPAFACPIQITASPRSSGESYDVRWIEIAGATRYDVFEKRVNESDFHLTHQIAADGEVPRFVASPSSTAPGTYEYLVIAQLPNGAACTGTTQFDLPGDQRLASVTHKRIVPFAGSVRGANGSDFRTALTLRHLPFASGKIVFRPVGKVASDSDPSMTYQFGDNGPTATDLHWDDVMAAMGASGVGTLEIIPNKRQDGLLWVPEIEAHVYNVTAQGTFGSRVPAVAPADWVRNELQWREDVSVPAVHGNYRRNAGFRTLTEVKYIVRVNQPGQSPQSGPLRTIPANFTVFGSVEDLFGGAVPADARVIITFIAGDAIGFYTNTENTTNDPTLIVRNPFEATNDVTWSY